jgi:hypothetical protein
MREIRTSGSEGGRAGNRSAYPTNFITPFGSGGRQKAPTPRLPSRTPPASTPRRCSGGRCVGMLVKVHAA